MKAKKLVTLALPIMLLGGCGTDKADSEEKKADVKVEQKSDDKSVKVKADKDVNETKSVKADDNQAEEYVSTVLHFMQEPGKPQYSSEERSALLKENCKKLKELTPPSSFVEEHKQLVTAIDILEDSFKMEEAGKTELANAASKGAIDQFDNTLKQIEAKAETMGLFNTSKQK
ncbi:hypothetical protein CN354_20920 [Bacillus cereus]|nr:hypothetical protein CN354_20920 [Bacillus cereus]